MPIRVAVVGVQKITKKFLNTLGITQAIDDGIKRDLGSFVNHRLAGRENYPAPTSSRYVRTYRLGDSWTTKQEGWMRYAIENLTTYAMFVVGDGSGANQAWMHVKRWWKARERINEVLPTLRKAIRENVKRYLD